MQTEDKYSIFGYSLKNIRNKTEERVISVFKDTVQHYPDFCGCHICLEDVYALSMNSLKPMYKHKLTIVLKSKTTTDEEIKKVLDINIKKIIGNPNHAKPLEKKKNI